MASTDGLDNYLTIYDQTFKTFTALRTFIENECPAKLADFQRKYGK